MAVAIWIVCADENWPAADAMSALLVGALPSACAVSTASAVVTLVTLAAGSAVAVTVPSLAATAAVALASPTRLDSTTLACVPAPVALSVMKSDGVVVVTSTE